MKIFNTKIYYKSKLFLSVLAITGASLLSSCVQNDFLDNLLSSASQAPPISNISLFKQKTIKSNVYNFGFPITSGYATRFLKIIIKVLIPTAFLL